MKSLAEVAATMAAAIVPWSIFMAIQVTMLCEPANKHGRSRCPTAAMWPHSRRQDTLQSANILQNKFTSLNLENIIVIYTIMTIKGKARCAGHLAIWSKMVPTAAMWPHSWRQDTLQSANILQNKFTSLNLENIIVIYTIMTIKARRIVPYILLSGPRW
jgi:hypothetical protein